MSNSHASSLAKNADNTVKQFVKSYCNEGINVNDWIDDMDMKSLLESMKYDKGNKAEVKIEHIESKTGGKSKKKKQKK